MNLPSTLNLIRFRFRKINSSFRIFYYRCLGMQVGEKVDLGTITCEWPNKVSIGNKTTVQEKVDFRLGKPFNKENFIAIGDRVFIGRCCEFNCSGRILVGDDCLIASNTTFVDIAHQMNMDLRMNEQECNFDEIVIKEDVWIGSHCVILKGVTIGKGAVVGAGSVVNKSVPAYQIWAGTPARFIRDRT